MEYLYIPSNEFRRLPQTKEANDNTKELQPLNKDLHVEAVWYWTTTQDPIILSTGSFRISQISFITRSRYNAALEDDRLWEMR